jgi:hypothetical protein
MYAAYLALVLAGTGVASVDAIRAGPIQVRPMISDNQWITYADWGSPAYVTWGAPQRAVLFHPADFQLTYPVFIGRVKSQFYWHASHPWDDSIFRYAVYSEAGDTLWMSDTLRAAHNAIIQADVVPPVRIDAGDLYVAIVPRGINGNPSTLADATPQGHSFNGSPGSGWQPWTSGEFFVSAWASYYGGHLLNPDGGQFWAGGDTQTINWTVSPKSFYYTTLLLSTDGGSTYPEVIAPSIVPSETAYAWLVPRYNYATCRVKMQAYDSSASLVFEAASVSNFTIDSQDPAAPSLIYPPQQGATNNPTVVFKWHRASDNLSGVAYHTIQIAYDSLFAAKVDTARRADTTFARVLPADTSYYWRVRATDRCGNVGPWSSRWKFEIDVQAPGVPTLLVPVGGQWLQSSTIGFQWTPVTFGSGLSAVRYVLQLDTTALFSHPLTDTLSAPFDTVNFLAEGHYWWRVRAYDLAGNQGTFSTAEAFGIDMSPPAIPSTIYPPHLSLIWTDTTSIIWHVAGDNLSGTELYHLQLARDSAFADTVTGFAPTAGDTHRHASIPDTINYYWRVRARDLAGNWSNWCQACVFTRLMTGLQAASGTSSGAFTVACNPNPFSRVVELRILLPKSMPVRAEVYNATGRRVSTICNGVLSAGVSSVRWDGTTTRGIRAEPGLYYIRVNAQGQTQTHALILVDN